MSKDWTQVARVDELQKGGTLRVFCGSEPVCLYNLDGKIYATHDTCTHGQASLSEGLIDGENIECPFHGGLFHIPSGQPVGAPCVMGIRVYPVRIEAGAVLVGNPD